MRRSSTRGCHDGSVEGAVGRTGDGERWEASPADSAKSRRTGSATDSAMGPGAAIFLGRPLRRLGAMESTGGASRGATGVLGAGCETEAGSRRCPRRLATGEEESGRVGASSTERSTLTVMSSATGGAWVDSRGGVSASTG